MVNWTTFTETNNDYFEIERSTNGSTYEAIGTIDGHGTSVMAHHYIFRDKDPLIGIAYYRLKQFDNNGDFHYTDWVAVRCNGETVSSVLYPNPSIGSNAFISVSGAKGEKVKVQVFSIDGKLVAEFDKTMTDDIIRFILNELEVERSVYQVLVMVGEQQFYKKWVVH